MDRCRDVIAANGRSVVYGGLVAASLIWLFVTRLLRGKNRVALRPASPDPEKLSAKPTNSSKAPQRPPGQWIPVQFNRPTAQPLLDWDVHTSEPLPYRPFKHGPYHITMGLRAMQWDEWIELDNHYLKFHAEKARRIDERGDQCCRTAPEAMDGALELLEEL